MTQLSEKEFVEWLTARELMWESQYGYIDFKSGPTDERFWTLPGRGARVVFLLAVILDSLEPWNYLMVCKQGAAGWYNSDDRSGIIAAVHDQIVNSTSVPKDFQGVFRAEKSDETAIITLLFNQLMFGWCMWDDVYAIPDHAQQIVKTSHHDVVHLSFKDPNKIASFVEKLAQAKFYLPTEVPDGTFKTPDWMRND